MKIDWKGETTAAAAAFALTAVAMWGSIGPVQSDLVTGAVPHATAVVATDAPIQRAGFDA